MLHARSLQGPFCVPMFLYGHTLGGLTVLTLLSEDARRSRLPRLVGAIVTSPLLRLVNSVSLGKQLFGRLASIFTPRSFVSTDLEPSLLSKDPAVVREYTADPLTHSHVSLSMVRVSAPNAAYLWGFLLGGLHAGPGRANAARGLQIHCDATAVGSAGFGR
jgi:alpha-beta hydrolase superfamily lysophospholipase